MQPLYKPKPSHDESASSRERVERLENLREPDRNREFVREAACQIK